MNQGLDSLKFYCCSGLIRVIAASLPVCVPQAWSCFCSREVMLFRENQVELVFIMFNLSLFMQWQVLLWVCFPSLLQRATLFHSYPFGLQSPLLGNWNNLVVFKSFLRTHPANKKLSAVMLLSSSGEWMGVRALLSHTPMHRTQQTPCSAGKCYCTSICSLVCGSILLWF